MISRVIKQVLWEDGVPGISGRIYPETVIRNAVESYQKEISSNRAVGTCGPNLDGTLIRLDKVSHKVKSLELKDGKLIGEFEILNTPLGDVAWKMLESGRFEFRLSGIGSVSKNNGSDVVSDYTIINIFCDVSSSCDRDVIIRC